MKRSDLEHIIRAAGSIADCERLIVIGSQAILGSFPQAPAELTMSEEADTYPLDAPEKAARQQAEPELITPDFSRATITRRIIRVEELE